MLCYNTLSQANHLPEWFDKGSLQYSFALIRCVSLTRRTWLWSQDITCQSYKPELKATTLVRSSPQYRSHTNSLFEITEIGLYPFLQLKELHLLTSSRESTFGPTKRRMPWVWGGHGCDGVVHGDELYRQRREHHRGPFSITLSLTKLIGQSKSCCGWEEGYFLHCSRLWWDVKGVHVLFSQRIGKQSSLLTVKQSRGKS